MGIRSVNSTKFNVEFGTLQELKELVQAYHDRGIWVMVGIVVTHIGHVDNFNYSASETVDPHADAKAFEARWLSGSLKLKLDQNHLFVRETLISWIQDLVKTYDLDAIRIDTVPHVTREF